MAKRRAKASKPENQPRHATASDVGKRILVGITTVDSEERVLHQGQYHGTVVEVSDNCIAVRWSTGETTTIPPLVADAAPGVYRLRSTGEEVVDPDLIAKWVFTDDGTERSQPT